MVQSVQLGSGAMIYITKFLNNNMGHPLVSKWLFVWKNVSNNIIIWIKWSVLCWKKIVDHGLISALHTFWKYNGAGILRTKSRKNLQGSKIIGVQPTTISRRKVYFGRRKVQTAGRSTKESRVYEHGYNKRKAPLSIDNIPMNKKKKAPHSIKYCTNQNINLGKQH